MCNVLKLASVCHRSQPQETWRRYAIRRRNRHCESDAFTFSFAKSDNGKEEGKEESSSKISMYIYIYIYMYM